MGPSGTGCLHCSAAVWITTSLISLPSSVPWTLFYLLISHPLDVKILSWSRINSSCSSSHGERAGLRSPSWCGLTCLLSWSSAATHAHLHPPSHRPLRPPKGNGHYPWTHDGLSLCLWLPLAFILGSGTSFSRKPWHQAFFMTFITVCFASPLKSAGLFCNFFLFSLSLHFCSTK